MQCVGELKEVIKTRKQMKIAKDRLPRWAEAEPMVVEHIMREVAAPSICALNLSNVLKSGTMRAEGHTFAPPLVARELANGLAKGGQDTVDALLELGGQGVVMWCPDNREDLGRIYAGLAKAAGQKVRAQVTLVIPMDPRPGCHNAGQFMDTWSHELLQDKWAPSRRPASAASP